MKVYLTKKQIEKIISEQISYDEVIKKDSNVNIDIVERTSNGVVLSFTIPVAKPHEKVNKNGGDNDPKAYSWTPVIIVVKSDFVLSPVGKNPKYCKWTVGSNISVEGDIPEDLNGQVAQVFRESYSPHNLVDKLMMFNHDKKNTSEKNKILVKLITILQNNIPEDKIDVDKL